MNTILTARPATPLRFLRAAFLFLGLALAPFALGQGITSSSLGGSVTNKQGQPVAGAAITAVHTPTNGRYVATSTTTGRFSFIGLPVGGPYLVTATSGGATIASLSDVYTQLGESTDVMLISGDEVMRLEAFSVTADANSLDASTTGTGSVLSNRRVKAQPTGNQSFADLIKTNPFVSLRASQQIQALGMNNRYNTITLDGAKINDSFGLASSGVFSLGNPFSLDAVEQVSIALAPYDIRQSGFAGASVNIVSKSGTNEFHGSAYFRFTDAKWQASDVSGANLDKRLPLKDRNYGFTFGGPILKDRLFFFLNIEKFIRDTAPLSPAFTPDSGFISSVDARLAQLPTSPSMGTFGGVTTSRLFDSKRLLKLDWNINQDHRLSVRYSETNGSQPNFGSINGTSFSQPVTITGQPASFPNGITSLSSNFYTLAIKEKVWAAQLYNNWSADLKTQFSYSNTKQDSVRETPAKFPEIRIFSVPGISNTGATITGGNSLRFGTETSSMGNELRIKTQTMAGSADYTWNTLTFTAGADFEVSDYFNLFRQGSYGFFDYLTLSDFTNDRPIGFARSVVSAGLPTADISKFEQTGLFAQVKWEPTSRFNVMLGVRMDYLGSPIAPTENPTFVQKFGVTNSGTVDGSTVPSPRLSFNYALDQKRMTQIRGGMGVFLGRNPWVWISNSFGNTGVGRFNVSKTVPATGIDPANYTGPTLAQYLGGTYSDPDSAYKFDGANPVGTTSATGSSSAINLIRPGLKPPTIRRGNIAIDRKVPFLDATVSIEYVETVQLSALFVDNMNLLPTSVGADGRQRFAGSSSAAPLVSGFGNVIRTRNVHAGKSQYVSVAIDRPFKKGWAYNLSYARGHATEAQSLNSSTANSQWQFNGVFNQNTVEVARSDYEIRDRVQASVSREFRFFNKLLTTASLYYEGRSGMPYSYVYGTDLNNDGFSTDLVAVPSGPTDARFDFSGMTPTQMSAYFNFLSSSGLSRFAGSYAKRNAFLTPWQNRLDIRVVQELPVYKNLKLEIFADFINFGAWLSKDFFNYIDLLNTSATNGGQGRLLGTAAYNATGQIRPGVTLDANNNIVFGSTSTFAYNNAESRWKIQGGVRLKF